MSESTLAIALTEIRNACCYLARFGTSYASASTEEATLLDDAIKQGQRLFYYPPTIMRNGMPYRHEWSFLKPVSTLVLWPTMTGACTGTTTVVVDAGDRDDLILYATMVGHTLVAGTSETSHTITAYTNAYTVTVTPTLGAASGEDFTITCDGQYRLPDDFGSLIDNPSFEAGSGYMPLQKVSDERIRRDLGLNESPGVPVEFAIVPVTSDSSTGQRFDLWVYPYPNQAYTMTYRYEVMPDALVETTNEYPLGGMKHGQAIKEACLACVELAIDGQYGPHYQQFITMALPTSIDMDLRQSAAQVVGTLNRPGQQSLSSLLVELRQRQGDVYFNDVLLE